ncbi:hypothetical protein [Thalassotalea sp. SU-HH00458]|uniref:hypothetical protein n=1 Tax=Thalassotalea sp. SU-HH00458 TaxID=3127657 RepID=UPI00310A34EC
MSNWQQHQVVLQYGKLANAFKKINMLAKSLATRGDYQNNGNYLIKPKKFRKIYKLNRIH